MFHKGDRFVIEIAESFKGAESGATKYRIKGFDSLVFDDKGLSKLTSYNDILSIEIAKAKKQEQAKFKPGDEVVWNDGKGILLSTGLALNTVLQSNGTVVTMSATNSAMHKTGHTYPLDIWLEILNS